MEAHANVAEKPLSAAREKSDEMVTHLQSAVALGMRDEELEVDKRVTMLLSGTSASDATAGMTRSATLQELKNRMAVDGGANYPGTGMPSPQD